MVVESQEICKEEDEEESVTIRSYSDSAECPHLSPRLGNLGIIYTVQGITEILYKLWKHDNDDFICLQSNVQACDGSATPTSLMMMVPSMASCRSCRVLRTLEITRCIRSISWRRKMLMGAMAPIFASLAFTWKGGREGGREGDSHWWQVRRGEKGLPHVVCSLQGVFPTSLQPACVQYSLWSPLHHWSCPWAGWTGWCQECCWPSYPGS